MKFTCFHLMPYRALDFAKRTLGDETYIRVRDRLLGST